MQQRSDRARPSRDRWLTPTDPSEPDRSPSYGGGDRLGSLTGSGAPPAARSSEPARGADLETLLAWERMKQPAGGERRRRRARSRAGATIDDRSVSRPGPLFDRGSSAERER